MSAAQVAVEIARFLASPEPEVLCISGRWGVGKTFAWNRYLEEARDNDKVALKSYAYVSLFGRRSLADLKQTIFESTVPTAKPKGAPIEDVSAKLVRLGRLATQFTAQLPKVGDTARFISQFYFLSVRDQIVCIDDLERAGGDLDARDVMGLASQLKEERRCKVVILLNQEQLSEENRKTYEAQLEKVSDVQLSFEPTAAEAAAIGVNTSTTFATALRRATTMLGITNIRVIKRIERFVRRVEPALAGFDREVFDQMLSTAVLFGWVVYQPDDAPPLAFLKTYNQIAHEMARGDKEADPNAKWRTLLQEYDYSMTDEFDLLIAVALEKGFVDEARLRAAAQVVQDQKRAARKDDSLENAWRVYHDSFDDNQEEVLAALDRGFRQSVSSVSPTNLNSTISLFKELGRPEQAEELLALYVQVHEHNCEALDLDDYAFAENVTDPDVIRALRAAYAALRDDRDPVEVFIQHAARGGGWHSEDLAKMAELTQEDFVRLFKESKGRELRSRVKAALQFRNAGNATPEMQQVLAAATAALQAIAAHSPLNARRVRGFGVSGPISQS